MKNAIILLSLFALLLCSCSKTIDGSSDEAMKSSIEEIKTSLSDDKKKMFEESLNLIMTHGPDYENLLEESEAKVLASYIREKIDGKTADDIIAIGTNIKIITEKINNENAKAEIEELYRQMAKAEKERKMISKFEVRHTGFYKSKKGNYRIAEEPIIELTVYNGMKETISRAYFTGTLKSPNRSAPWLQDDFFYEIPGGIKPGEELTFYIVPSISSDWGKVNAPKDAVLTVEVTRLDGPGREKLYTVEYFGEEKQARLKELVADYPEFKK
jgi:hypothetical protein